MASRPNSHGDATASRQAATSSAPAGRDGGKPAGPADQTVFAGRSHPIPNSHDLVRFSVAMPEGLLMRFDHLVARRGLAKNRSEVVRELVRDALAADECDTPGTIVVGTLTIVFEHHGGVQEKLDVIQHDYYETIVSSLHVHLDQDHCMEVIVMRGETGLIQDIGNRILGTKGVRTGKLVLTTTGDFI